MQLPSIEHAFDHARIEKVIVGPRREIILHVCRLQWDGPKGEYTEAIPLRFGGIYNFDEAVAFFDARPHEQSELAWVQYAEERLSKPGRLFVELRFERTDACLIVECHSVQVES